MGAAGSSRAKLPKVLDLPPMEPPVFVAGDVHLHADDPVVTRGFLTWLETLAGQGGSLVLLGDLFDAWAGRKQAAEPLARTVLDALRALEASGTRLFFLPGNRDFHFDGADGLSIGLWPDLVRTRWGEATVLLTHGDLLCTADTGYLVMRWMLRGPLGRLVGHVLPYGAKRFLARSLRGASSRATKTKSYDSMRLDYGAARAWMEALEADVLVAGHVHTGVHHRLSTEPAREVFVLKDWAHGGDLVRFDQTGIRLVRPATGPGSDVE